MGGGNNSGAPNSNQTSNAGGISGGLGGGSTAAPKNKPGPNIMSGLDELEGL